MNFIDLKSKALDKTQMRAIKGGINGNGTCGAISATGTVRCGISKEQALATYADNCTLSYRSTII